MKLLSLIPTFSVVLVLATATPICATETLSQDGEWWNGLTEEQRVYAVEGMLDAYQAGYFEAALDSASYVTSHSSAKTSVALSPALMDLPVPRFSSTFGTYIDEITDCYVNYPSMTTLDVGQVLNCLRDDAPSHCEENMVKNAGG